MNPLLTPSPSRAATTAQQLTHPARPPIDDAQWPAASPRPAGPSGPPGLTDTFSRRTSIDSSNQVSPNSSRSSGSATPSSGASQDSLDVDALSLQLQQTRLAHNNAASPARLAPNSSRSSISSGDLFQTFDLDPLSRQLHAVSLASSTQAHLEAESSAQGASNAPVAAPLTAASRANEINAVGQVTRHPMRGLLLTENQRARLRHIGLALAAAATLSGATVLVGQAATVIGEARVPVESQLVGETPAPPYSGTSTTTRPFDPNRMF